MSKEQNSRPLLNSIARSVRLCLAIILFLGVSSASAASLPWKSQDRYRTLLNVDPKAAKRSNCPAAVDIDFPRLLKDQGAAGSFDENTIEVVAYDQAGPVVFDKTRGETEKFLLPCRIDKYYGLSKVTLHFVIPNERCRQFAVYFDTQSSGHGHPQRYPGIVGDGDFFREEFGRREINACHFDTFCDFDGDGDLDLFKGGVEPYVYVYENVGGNRMLDRGRLSSGGNLFTLPNSAGRSWLTVAFCDIDGDGDQDFFPSFGDGPDSGKIIYYKNTTRENGGVLTFTRVGPLVTVSGTPLAGGKQAGGWFPSITFVKDWDGDGDDRMDALVGSNSHCYLYRNLGPGPNGPRFADAVALQADGQDITPGDPRFDVADIDGDGDLDLFAGCQGGPISWYKNTGTRKKPVFAAPVIVAYPTPYMIGDAHAAVKVADFDGDGLLDIVVGRFWERTPISEAAQPRYFGGLHKNVGTKDEPKFERRDAEHGSPFTERFQMCDAVRQNSLRMVDWNDDGKPDLLAGDTDGFIYFFRNVGDRLFPLFAPGKRLQSGGELLTRYHNGGHARFDITDWNNDGKRDLVVADGSGGVVLYPNTDTNAQPVLGAAEPLQAEGKPLTIGTRSSLVVCDFDNDGKKDLITADETRSYRFFRNIGDDAKPALAAGTPIAPGGRERIPYARPNLGSFVDWDGDGKRDLIGCGFENNVRFYKNGGSGKAGEEPQFASAQGDIIIEPPSPQIVSGADAVDWNGDGDLDILTGQGHGGSGLRFFERDFIESTLHKTWPVVTVGATESK